MAGVIGNREYNLRRVPVLLLMGVGCASTAVRWGLIWAFPVPSVILMSNVLHMFGFGLALIAFEFRAATNG